MARITIEIGGRPTTYDASRALRVGRETGCDILLQEPTVSRNHAELRPVGDAWEVVDAGSTHGTWVNGQRVDRMVLPAGTTILRFGLTEGGATAHVTVEGAPPAPADRPAGPPTAAVPPAALAPTVLPTTQGTPGMPGGGPGLLVRTRTADLRFGTHAPVRIGREPGLEVTIDDAGVSRQHAVVEPRPDGWWYVDRSTSGSFVEGERVVQRRLEDPTTTVLLGHPTAGYELELVPVLSASAASRAIAGRKRRRTLAVVAAVVALLVLVGGGITAAVLLGDDDSDGGGGGGGGDGAALTEAELDRAKLASVLLLAVDGSGQVFANGSGSIISEDGLILTNAHVAQPSAPGQGGDPSEDPDYLRVALNSDDDDRPAEATYRARPVVVDGVLDLAVLQIYADIDGNEVDPAEEDLPEPMPIGDSDELRTGDEITALGYPLLAANPEDFETRQLTVTRGVVSTFQHDPIIDVDRANIDSDIRIGSGNSGGASINDDGELIGVNSAVITSQTTDQLGSFTGGSALIRPINLAEEIIEIAEEGGDPDYVSPYLDNLPTDPSDLPSEIQVVSAGWTGDGQGGCSGSSTPDEPQQYAVPNVGDTIYAEFSVVGLEDGTPVTFEFFDLAGQNVQASFDQVWNFGSGEVCIFVPFTVPEGANGADAAFVVGQQVLAENPVVFVEVQ